MRQKGKREKKEREKESGRGIAGACVSTQHTVIAIFDVNAWLADTIPSALGTLV